MNYVTDELKVDGITISPGFAYERAPDQGTFLLKDLTPKISLEKFLNQKNLKNGISVILVYILIFLSWQPIIQSAPWGKSN